MNLLRVSDAAAALTVSTRTVRSWILSGALPVVKVGPRPVGARQRDTRAVRIEASEVQKLMEKPSRQIRLTCGARG